MKKIVSFKESGDIFPLGSGKRTVLAGGCFDLLHYGHLTFLRRAKKAGDYLIIALESDEFIKKRKDRVAIHNQNQRAEILAALEIVDLVINLPLFKSDNDYFKLIQTVRPRVIAVTAGDPQLGNKRKQASEIKAKVKIVSPLIRHFSSKEIIKKIL